ncbi:MAG: hypothetical protein JO287_04500 [Pseudonocardiales bacterium]|nr:hypothetical protein [Pseudonocardiales bacterium]
MTVKHGSRSNFIYQIDGKSFVSFHIPRPGAFDPETRECYANVIVFWVASESDKQALIQDQASPFFTIHTVMAIDRCGCGESDWRAHPIGIG